MAAAAVVLDAEAPDPDAHAASEVAPRAAAAAGAAASDSDGGPQKDVGPPPIRALSTAELLSRHDETNKREEALDTTWKAWFYHAIDLSFEGHDPTVRALRRAEDAPVLGLGADDATVTEAGDEVMALREAWHDELGPEAAGAGTNIDMASIRAAKNAARHVSCAGDEVPRRHLSAIKIGRRGTRTAACCRAGPGPIITPPTVSHAHCVARSPYRSVLYLCPDTAIMVHQIKKTFGGHWWEDERAGLRIPSCRQLWFPSSVLDSNAMRRADGSMAIVATPGAVAQLYAEYARDASESAAANEDRALFDASRPEDVMLLLTLLLATLEYGVRMIKVESSALAWIARRLGPRGRGVPYPGIARRWQTVYFACTYAVCLALRLLGFGLAAGWVLFASVTSVYGSWLCGY